MIFCDRIRHELMDNSSSKSFTVTGIDVKGLKYVLDWIKASVHEKKTADFQKAGSPGPLLYCELNCANQHFIFQFDQEDPDIFLKYLNAIIAANYLGIPARDFADNMTKVMLGVARNVQMTWDQVEYFLYDPALASCSDQVRGVATASIFYAWWRCKLTDEDAPADMEYLSYLRDNDEKLDQDLHDWCVRNKEEIERKRAEKRAKRDQEAAGAGYGAGADYGAPSGFPTAADVGGGWEMEIENTVPVATGGWDNPSNADSVQTNAGSDDVPMKTISTQSGDKGWDSGIDIATRETTPGANDAISTIVTEESTRAMAHAGAGGGLPTFESDAAAGGDWADEVNQHDQYANQQW